MRRAASVRCAEGIQGPISGICSKAREMLGMRLCVLHNLYFYNTMMAEIREAIEAGNYQEYKKRKLEGMQKISRN